MNAAKSEKKKFAAFDIDGTIFRWQLYHELFDAFSEAGLIDARETGRVIAARNKWSIRDSSFTDYEETLVGVMERAIIGLPEQTVRDMAGQILQQKGMRTYAYTRKLLATLRDQGYFLIAISGSHHQLVEPFARLHSIDVAYGSQFEIVKGKFHKRSAGVLGRKDEILHKIVASHDLSWDDSYAVGDSGGDISMLQIVTHPIAFNPDDRLFAAAVEHGWRVVIERKNMIYELENHDGTYLLAQANSRQSALS